LTQRRQNFGGSCLTCRRRRRQPGQLADLGVGLAQLFLSLGQRGFGVAPKQMKHGRFSFADVVAQIVVACRLAGLLF